MILNDAVENALLDILGRNFNEQDPPEVADIYREAGFDRADSIVWADAARPKWKQILRLHGPDILVLIEAIESLGYAGVAGQLRQALEAAPRAVVAATRALTSAHQPMTLHLQCDRKDQWDDLIEATKTPPLTIYLFGGARGLGHKLFLDRIRYDTSDLRAHCVDVYPAAVERPSKIEHAVAGLRDIFGAEDVGEFLRQKLDDRTVIFIHRPVGLMDQAKSWLPDYVGVVLPALAELVGQARRASASPVAGRGALVAVIPIEWKHEAAEFQAMLGELQQRAPNVEMVVPVDLEAIERSDVEGVLRKVTKPNDARTRAQRIIAESTSTAEIFANLEEELRRVPVGSL
jgi:hypothetical protein